MLSSMCAFSNVSSSGLPQRMTSYTGCICLAFPHCVYSNASSNRLPEKRHCHIGCIVFLFSTVRFQMCPQIACLRRRKVTRLAFIWQSKIQTINDSKRKIYPCSFKSLANDDINLHFKCVQCNETFTRKSYIASVFIWYNLLLLSREGISPVWLSIWFFKAPFGCHCCHRCYNFES